MSAEWIKATATIEGDRIAIRFSNKPDAIPMTTRWTDTGTEPPSEEKLRAFEAQFERYLNRTKAETPA